eukprot:jgi/Mesvir1/26245/Mv05723-RA.1
MFCMLALCLPAASLLTLLVLVHRSDASMPHQPMTMMTTIVTTTIHDNYDDRHDQQIRPTCGSPRSTPTDRRPSSASTTSKPKPTWQGKKPVKKAPKASPSPVAAPAMPHPVAAAPAPVEESALTPTPEPEMPTPEATPEPVFEPQPVHHEPAAPVLVVEDDPLMLPDDTPAAHRKPTLLHTGLGRSGHRHSEDDLEAIQQKVLFSIPDEDEEKRLFGYSVTGRKAGAAAVAAASKPSPFDEASGQNDRNNAQQGTAPALGLRSVVSRVRPPREIPSERLDRADSEPVERCTVRIPILDDPPREARPAETPVPPKCKIFVDCGAASMAESGAADARRAAAAALVGDDRVHHAVVVAAPRKQPQPPPAATKLPGKALRRLLQVVAAPLGLEVVAPGADALSRSPGDAQGGVPSGRSYSGASGLWNRGGAGRGDGMGPQSRRRSRSLLAAAPSGPKGKSPPSSSSARHAHPSGGKKGAPAPPAKSHGGKGGGGLDVESLKRAAHATTQQLRVANQDQRASGFAMEASSWTQNWLRGPNAPPLRPPVQSSPPPTQNKGPATPAPSGPKSMSLAEARQIRREHAKDPDGEHYRQQAAAHVQTGIFAELPASSPVFNQVINVAGAGIGRGHGELYPEEVRPLAREVNLFNKPTQMSVTRMVMSHLMPGKHTCEQAERACGPMGHRSKLHLYSHALGTCAVVGLGKNILQQEYGPEIDAHTTVFRMGYTPVKGYEWNVGTKTSVLFLRTLIRDNQPVEGTDVWRGTAYAPSKFYMYHSHNGGTRSPVGVYMGIPFTSLEGITDQRADAELYDQLLRYATLSKYADTHRTHMEPSSGFRLVMSLLHSGLCSRIDLYGFSLTGVGHYFRGDPAKHGQDLVMYYKHVLGLEYYAVTDDTPNVGTYPTCDLNWKLCNTCCFKQPGSYVIHPPLFPPTYGSRALAKWATKRAGLGPSGEKPALAFLQPLNLSLLAAQDSVSRAAHARSVWPLRAPEAIPGMPIAATKQDPWQHPPHGRAEHPHEEGVAP